jgi:hypothetical protein
MSDDKMLDVVTTDVKEDVAPEPAIDSIQESTRQKKLAQLAAARESAKIKKRKREEDMDSMSARLDKLTSLLLTKDTKQEHRDDEEEEEPPKVKKPKRVTREPPETTATVVHEAEDSWTTSIIRTGSLLGLAGLSYYFQNMYGKNTTTVTPRAHQKKKIESKPHIIKPVQPNSIPNPVGQSGFTF